MGLLQSQTGIFSFFTFTYGIVLLFVFATEGKDTLFGMRILRTFIVFSMFAMSICVSLSLMGAEFYSKIFLWLGIVSLLFAYNKIIFEILLWVKGKLKH